MANLGDQLGDYCPVSFSPEEFGGYVITLTHKGTVAKYGLPTSVSNPVTLAPPTGDQPGDERLHWTPILEPVDDIPCFGALPLACPVLPRDPAFDGLSILDDLDPGTVTAAPMFAHWFAGYVVECRVGDGNKSTYIKVRTTSKIPHQAMKPYFRNYRPCFTPGI